MRIATPNGMIKYIFIKLWIVAASLILKNFYHITIVDLNNLE